MVSSAACAGMIYKPGSETALGYPALIGRLIWLAANSTGCLAGRHTRQENRPPTQAGILCVRVKRANQTEQCSLREPEKLLVSLDALFGLARTFSTGRL
jgi:hypothetical protein